MSMKPRPMYVGRVKQFMHGCKTKHRHNSYGAAKAHIRSMDKRGLEADNLEPYLCSLCTTWHVGHKKGYLA